MLEPCPSAEGKKLQRMIGWVWGKAHFCPTAEDRAEMPPEKDFALIFSVKFVLLVSSFSLFLHVLVRTHTHTRAPCSPLGALVHLVPPTTPGKALQPCLC